MDVTLPQNLCDLLAVAPVATGRDGDAAEALRRLGAPRTVLVMLADARGRLLYAQGDGTAAAALARRLARRLFDRLAGRSATIVTLRGSRKRYLAAALRLPADGAADRPALIACLVESPTRIGGDERDGGGETDHGNGGDAVARGDRGCGGSVAGEPGVVAAWQVPRTLAEVSALVAVACFSVAARTRLKAARFRARAEQLEAQHKTLRASHSEALSAAIEEREARLRQQEEHVERLRAIMAMNQMILDSVGEGIFGLDSAGRFTFVNPAAARMLGYAPERLIGVAAHELIHHSMEDGKPLDREGCDIERTLRDGSVVHAKAGAFWRADGTSFPVEFSSAPIRDGQSIVGSVVGFRDVTERRMLEAQLRQAQKLESIGQLAAGIAHEINTPTQYLTDNTKFLAESFHELRDLLETCHRLGQLAPGGDGSDHTGDLAALVETIAAEARSVDVPYLLGEIPRALEQSLEGLDRVARIVRSMKEFSHPGGGQKQAVDLNHAIESTLTVSRNEWKYVAEMVTQLDPELPPVQCLPGEINQVMLNLVINAAHAIAEKQRAGGSSEKGTITVSTRRDGDWVEIRVADTGTGIPESIRAKVFDPFFTTKEVGRGTGQGLAIARSVVRDKHGGTIDFETELGRGTTFVVRLPIGRNDSPPGEGAA